MIRIILGNIGSGKTLTTVKEIMNSPFIVYSNVGVKHPNLIRLKFSHIIADKQIGETKSGKPIMKKVVNWNYWREAIKKHKYFHVYIDELHNIMPSRLSMSKQNIVMAQWVAQIRKVTGSSEMVDLVVVSQELQRIDVTIRDLASELMFCQKIEKLPFVKTQVLENRKLKWKKLPKTYVLHNYFLGDGNVSRYWQWRDMEKKTYDYRTYFYANPFMKYYDTYELVEFGESEYL